MPIQPTSHFESSLNLVFWWLALYKEDDEGDEDVKDDDYDQNGNHDATCVLLPAKGQS